jgi:hypothetical protein
MKSLILKIKDEMPKVRVADAKRNRRECPLLACALTVV